VSLRDEEPIHQFLLSEIRYCSDGDPSGTFRALIIDLYLVFLNSNVSVV